MTRRLLIIIIIAAAVSGVYYFNLTKQNSTQEANAAKAYNDAAPAAGEAAEAKPVLGSTFELVNQDGKKVTDKDLHGKKTLVYFGFTNCPDICPVTMAVMTEVMNQLQTAKVNNIIPVFITVDPERDTPKALKSYLKDYHENFIALTGPKEEIEKVEKGYKVYAEKADAKTGNVNHSDLIYYMDENGQYITHFNGQTAPEDIVDYITNH